MQSTSSAVSTLFNQSHTIKARPQVIIEWNWNRYAPTLTASSHTSSYTTKGTQFITEEDAEQMSKVDEDPYPISSIILPNRPHTGLPKARIGEAKVTGRNSTQTYRTVSKNAAYKYWTSPNQSNGSGAIVNAHAAVVYSAGVSTNKIVVKVEHSWASPLTRRLQITTDGTNWTDIGDGGTSLNGVFTVYRQANGTWGTTVNRGNPQVIRGVRFIPDLLSRGNAHFSLIEISARLEEDVSADVISVDITKSMLEQDLSSPVGTISSNVANVQLDNSGAKYDPDNTGSPYAGLIQENAEVRVAYEVETAPGVWEAIPQGVFYADNWGLDAENTVVSLETTDFAKFLQVQKMPPRLFSEETIPTVLREILRSVGFNNFIIDTTAEGQYIIPFVWFSSEDTVWTAISQLMKAVQCAVYFDELGRLVYLSRTALFEKTTPDYALIYSKTGSTLPNIINLTQTDEQEVNKVTINYTPANVNQKRVRRDNDTLSDDDAQFEEFIRRTQPVNYYKYDSTPINSILWKPEGTVVLQASPLQQSLTNNGKHMYIKESDAQTFPYRSMVNIEGEIIEYTAKQYKWYKNGIAQYTLCSNDKQKRDCDRQSDQGTFNVNRFTGYLAYLRRGMKGTTPAAHAVDIAGWVHYRKGSDASVVDGSSSVKLSNGEMQLFGQSGSYEQYLLSTRGSSGDAYSQYGTRFRFANVNSSHQTAGMFFNLQGDNKQGYYVEFNTTQQAVTTLKGAVANIRLYRMLADGNRIAIPGTTEGIRGVDYNIVRNQWLSVDVTRQGAFISVYVNGQRVISAEDTTFGSGRWGMFTRGHSVAAFEYFYINNKPDVPDIEESSFWNKIEGGYTSGYANREVLRDSKNQVLWFMDEFSPIVHELREFDVVFDKFPAIHPYSYLSNNWDAFVVEINSTPFGAKLLIANGGRDAAILNGDDTNVIFGETVTQQMMVYGQLVVKEESKRLVVKDNNSIRRAGENELEFDSPWIQTEAMAQEIGEFFVSRWGGGLDVVSCEVFVNPGLQVGDLVSINWPERSMAGATHRYHVVEIATRFETGITSTLTLRRA